MYFWNICNVHFTSQLKVKELHYEQNLVSYHKAPLAALDLRYLISKSIKVILSLKLSRSLG